MKIQIEDKEFILASSANLVRAAYQVAKCADERHQIVKALIERFPAVRDMDMEDLLQFLAMLPSAGDIKCSEAKLTLSNFEIDKLKDKLARATQACEAVADARMLMTDGSISNEIEDAIEKCMEVAHGADRRYPPALNPCTQNAFTCTCNHCQQGRDS